MSALPDVESSPEADLPAPETEQRPVAVRTENLAVVFTYIVGYTARTGRQSREENARMLAEHDQLLIPLVRAFGGRKIKSIGDALLLTLRSRPTRCCAGWRCRTVSPGTTPRSRSRSAWSSGWRSASA